MQKQTLQLRPGDLLYVHWKGALRLYRFHSKRRSVEFPVYVVRLDPFSDSSGFPETIREGLELAVKADQVWWWAGMTRDAKPQKIHPSGVGKTRPLVRTT